MAQTSERLSEAMRMRGLDQSALARDLGVTQGAISKIVLGKTSNSRLMPRIATLLRVPLPWLLGMSDELSPTNDAAPPNERDADQVEVEAMAIMHLTTPLGRCKQNACPAI